MNALRKAPFPYNPYDFLPEVPTFTLTSADVTDGVQMSAVHTSKAFGLPGGQDLSPQLAWSGFPAQTKSFALTCFDADAPTASGYWHWAVADIPATVTDLPTGAGRPGSAALPTTALTLANSSGDPGPGYGGSGPPAGHGPHRYFFVVHAVDVESLGLDASARPEMLGFTLAFHTLARAYLVPTSETSA